MLLYAITLSSLYPGDAYVDWSCLDGYNRPEYGWYGFNQLFTGSGTNFLQNSYQQVLAIAPSKPMMIGETASYDTLRAADRPLRPEPIDGWPRLTGLWSAWLGLLAARIVMCRSRIPPTPQILPQGSTATWVAWKEVSK